MGISLFDVSLPERCVVLVLGPPGVGKSKLYFRMANKRLGEKGSVCVIATDNQPEVIKKRAELEGVDFEGPENEGKLLFISGYSSLSGKRYEKGLNSTSLSNLEDLDYNIYNAKERLSNPIHFFFDTFSTMYIHNPAPTLAKFYQLISAQIKASVGSITFLIHEGMHPPEVVATLCGLSDGVFELAFDNNMNSIYRIRFFKGYTSYPKEWKPL